jgi:hypothetical protein
MNTRQIKHTGYHHHFYPEHAVFFPVSDQIFGIICCTNLCLRLKQVDDAEKFLECYRAMRSAS